MNKTEIILLLTLLVLIVYIFVSNHINNKLDHIPNKRLESFENLPNNNIIKGIGLNNNFERVADLYSLKLSNNDNTIFFYLRPYSNNNIIGQVVYDLQDENSIFKKFQVIYNYEMPNLNIKKFGDGFQLNSNSIKNNDIKTKTENFLNYMNNNIFDDLMNLDLLLKNIKNHLDILQNDKSLIDKLNTKMQEAESINNIQQINNFNRRLNSLKMKVNENICEFQSLIFSEHSKSNCNSNIQQDNNLEFFSNKIVKSDLYNEINLPIYLDYDELEYINSFNYQLKIKNKLDQLNELIHSNTDGFLFHTLNLNKIEEQEQGQAQEKEGFQNTTTTTSTIYKESKIDFRSLNSLNAKYNDILKVYSNLNKTKKEILKEINSISSDKSDISIRNLFYNLQVVDNRGIPSKDYTVIGNYIGKNSDFSNNGNLKNVRNSPIIVPKHCCLWKREWNNGDIIYRKGNIRIYKNPFTNTFYITNNNNSPRENNLRDENNNFKHGIYKFIACPDKITGLEDKINRFNEIRNNCTHIQQELQSISLDNDEIGIETEKDAFSKIEENDKRILLLEKTIKEAHRNKINNKFVKQNINRLRLTEINRKLENLYNELKIKLKKIYIDKEFNIVFDDNVTRDQIRNTIRTIFEKIRDSNLNNKADIIKKINTMLKIKYLSNDDLQDYLANLSNSGSCSNIIDMDNLFPIDVVNSCYKCNSLQIN